jgi:dethiobiotin synthetase
MTLFITGTGTGVGKTVLTVALARRARELGLRVAALKPLCSGGRGDARALLKAGCGRLTLDQVNPWWYRAALSPAIAAAREGRPVRLQDAVARVREASAGADVTLVEGAGGLLSPLGEDFDSRDLIRDIPASPVVAASNTLGVINFVLLTWEALPARSRRSAQVVLMAPARAGAVTDSNTNYLRQALGSERVLEFPFLPHWDPAKADASIPAKAKETLDAVLRGQAIPGSARVRGSSDEQEAEGVRRRGR